MNIYIVIVSNACYYITYSLRPEITCSILTSNSSTKHLICTKLHMGRNTHRQDNSYFDSILVGDLQDVQYSTRATWMYNNT